MLTTTLAKIRANNPPESGWKTLLKGLGGQKKHGLKNPLAYTRILEINGLDYCIWVIAQTMDDPHRSTILRLFTVACAQDVLRLMEDPRSRDAVRVAHLYAHGEVDDAAWDAAGAAAGAVWAAVRAARDAAWDAVGTAVGAVWAAARERYSEWLRVILENYEAAWMED